MVSSKVERPAICVLDWLGATRDKHFGTLSRKNVDWHVCVLIRRIVGCLPRDGLFKESEPMI
jgi:hypothetical protein